MAETSPFRWLKAALVPLMLAALAACATPFNAKVSRFQNQLPVPAGQTFAVVADDPALSGGIEFGQYASLVEGRLAALGYVPARPEAAQGAQRRGYPPQGHPRRRPAVPPVGPSEKTTGRGLALRPARD